MPTTETKLVNKIANSKLKIINLEKFYPEIEIAEFDLKAFLFKELILKEKEFRISLKELDWTAYEDKTVALYCSADAIIPTWAYMLVASHLVPYTDKILMKTKDEIIEEEYRNRIAAIDYAQYRDELIVIKGCSGKKVPASAYVELTTHLRPIARSIMFGEACSTVPIYKKPKNRIS